MPVAMAPLPWHGAGTCLSCCKDESAFIGIIIRVFAGFAGGSGYNLCRAPCRIRGRLWRGFTL